MTKNSKNEQLKKCLSDIAYFVSCSRKKANISVINSAAVYDVIVIKTNGNDVNDNNRLAAIELIINTIFKNRLYECVNYTKVDMIDHINNLINDPNLTVNETKRLISRLDMVQRRRKKAEELFGLNPTVESVIKKEESVTDMIDKIIENCNDMYMQNYINLACAIVEQAATDYKNVVKELDETYSSPSGEDNEVQKLKTSKRYIEGLFTGRIKTNSKKINILPYLIESIIPDLSGKDIIEKCHKTVKEQTRIEKELHQEAFDADMPYNEYIKKLRIKKDPRVSIATISFINTK